MIKFLYGTPPVTEKKLLTTKSLAEVVKEIKSDKELKNTTLSIRKAPEEERAQLKKTLLPYILPYNYSMPQRSAKYFISANCLMFETDHVENVDDVIAELKKNPHVLLLYRSVSNDGFKVLINCNTEVDKTYFKRVYNVVKLDLTSQYNVIFDPSSNDLVRVQFLSYDPSVYYNPKASPYDVSTVIKRLRLFDSTPTYKTGTKREVYYSAQDITDAINYIRENGFLEMRDEPLWWRLSMSLASLGEEGRDFFIQLSSNHPLYPNDTPKKLNKMYDQFLRTWGLYHDEHRLLNINSFFATIEKTFGYKPLKQQSSTRNLELVLTDKFVKKYRDVLLFDHSKTGRAKTYGWYIYNDGVFTLSQKGEISDYYLSMLEEEKEKTLAAEKQGKVIKTDIDTSERLLTLAEIARAESRRFRDLTLTWAGEREGLGALPDEFDADNALLNVINGVINLEDGKLLPHSPAYKMTKHSPVVYQENAKCPTWESFVNKICYNNKEMVSYIQEAVGYSLTGYTSEQCLFFLYGIGANGKSTFLEGLKLIFGDYLIHANYETFTNLNRDGNSHSEDIVRLKGARLVVSSEINSNKSLNESMIKQITAGDTITARDLHSSSIEFKPTFKLWIAGNHKPTIHNFDKGIQRRLFIIPFEYVFQESEIRPQHEVLKEFEEEKSGILTWAIEGAKRWIKRKKLLIPQVVSEATSEYFLENNLIAQFLLDSCITKEDNPTNASLMEEAKNLYQAYIAFTDRLNETRLGRNHFYKKLEELGYKRTMSSQQALSFKGVKLKDEAKAQAQEDSEPAYKNLGRGHKQVNFTN